MPRKYGEHIFEKYTNALTNRIKKEVGFIEKFIAPPGGHIPFTDLYNAPDALAWWKENINSEYGKLAMKGMEPLDIIRLQQKLREMDDAEAGVV